MQFFNPINHQMPREIEYCLYYDISCIFSRQLRVLMEENELNYKIIKYNSVTFNHEERVNFEQNNPSKKLPLIKIKNLEHAQQNSIFIYGIDNCINFVNIRCKHFVPLDFRNKVNMYNHLFLINNTFYNEVVAIIVYEKIIKYFISKETPNSLSLNSVRKNLKQYIKMFSRLINTNTKLSCETLSLSDIALFANISILDYINEISWQENQILKEWYLILKSRPCFKKILSEFIPGFMPSPQYQSLDF